MDSLRLARYLAGEASAGERAEVDAWARSDPAHAEELARLQAGWAPPPSTQWDIDRAWTRMQDRLRNPVARGSEVPVVPLYRRPLLWAAAAAAVLILGLGLGRWWTGESRGTVYATGIGEQRTLRLPDSSTVSLAPASRLRVRASFGRAGREVELEGHAWFSVRHDEASPFRVLTSRSVIEDLGTEFQVETHGGEVQVAVISGSVSVRGRDQQPIESVTLGPRDVAVVGTGAAPTVSREVAVDRMVGWRDGTLAFDGLPARLVLGELERWYPVTFRLPDSSLAERHLYVTLPTADLEEAVDIVGAALGAKATQSGRTITLVPDRSR
jgi:transmembrane sensor